MAADVAAHEKAAFKAMAKAGYPKDPAWRARHDILRQIHEMTGWQIICTVGGPVNGRTDLDNDPFKVMVLSVGTNRVPSPISFTNYHPRKFEEFTTLFKQYFATCYNENDIQSYQVPPGHTLDSLREEPIDVLQAAKYRIDSDDSEDNDNDGSVTTQSDLVVNPADRRRQEAILAEQQAKEAQAEAEHRKRDAEEQERQCFIAEGAVLIAAARSPEGQAKAAAELETKRRKETEEEALRTERMRRVQVTGKELGESDVEMSHLGGSDVEMSHLGCSDVDTSLDGGMGPATTDEEMDFDGGRGAATTDEELDFHQGGPPTTDDDDFPSFGYHLDSPTLRYDIDLPSTSDKDKEGGNDRPPRRKLDVGSDGEAADLESDGKEGGDEDGEEGGDEATAPLKSRVVEEPRKPRNWWTQLPETQPDTLSAPRRGRSAAVPPPPRRGRSVGKGTGH
ncbi:hypothetical protein C8F01DRAFT_1084394 [Mycena amicta]|nr:hypothetical protein C8F01DRAFT_1084394 [Mycena amicta]